MAVMNRRRWIGSEISGEYCRMIDERMGRGVQVNLFD